MRKVLITRHAAYGDHIHASHLPRLLKEQEGFDFVAFEYNPKGLSIYQNNPFIDEHIHIDPLNYTPDFMAKRWKAMMEQDGYERHINLQNSLEYGLLAMEDQNEYYTDSQYRRENYGKINYYDATSVYAGFPSFMGNVGEIYFTDEEIACVKSVYDENYYGKFVIICNLSGSSKHKLFYKAEEIIKEFLEKNKDAVCILTGDNYSRENYLFSGERIIDRCGNFNDEQYYPFRQSMLMAKFADVVIGAESGLMVASTLLGTPTIQLMTAASIKNHGGSFENDYSLQSPCVCSPCHKGPYQYIGCPKFEYKNELYPECIKFDKEVILKRLDEVYLSKEFLNATA